MSDVLNEIIDRLPPSTVNMLMQTSRDSQSHGSNLTNSLNESQQCKLNQIVKELKRKTNELKSKTVENKNYLAKIKSDLKNMKLCKNSDENQQKIKTYLTKIKELETQSKSLTRHFGEVDLPELFNNVESLQEEIEEYKKKISEVEKKFNCYNGFPPDVEQAKEVIAKIKEDIRNNELIVEANLQM